MEMFRVDRLLQTPFKLTTELKNKLNDRPCLRSLKECLLLLALCPHL